MTNKSLSKQIPELLKKKTPRSGYILWCVKCNDFVNPEPDKVYDKCPTCGQKYRIGIK